MSARFTSIPSAAHTAIPASSTADGSSSLISGPAASQNTDSITSAGTSSRHSVTTFAVGTCHSRANGTSASSPARRASASQYDPDVILSFRVGRCCDLRRPVVDSVADGTLEA